MSERQGKNTSAVAVSGEQKDLVQILVEQNKRILKLLEKQQTENRILIDKLEITTQIYTSVNSKLLEIYNTDNGDRS